MEAREDAECDCQAAFAEAQRWVEVRASLGPLKCHPPDPGLAGPPVPPLPHRGSGGLLAAPPGRAQGHPRRAGAPETRLPNFLFLCRQLRVAIFRRYRESLRRSVFSVSPRPPSPKSKLKAGRAPLLSLRLVISCYLVNYFFRACFETV